MSPRDPGLLDELAARYALGLQTARVRRRMVRLAARDAGVAAAVTRWETRASEMSASVPSIRPPERVWAAVEARLTPASTPRPARAGWLGWWRPALGLAMVVMVAAGLVQVIGPHQPLPGVEQALPASYVGILADGGGTARLLVSSQRHGRTVHVKWLSPPQVPPGTRAELWALPKAGAPFFLGTLPLSDHGTLAMADTSEALLSQVTRLAVAYRSTGDPAQPPGEFVLTGHCAKLW